MVSLTQNADKYRVYGPWMGGWLSRDPIEENDGLNVYGFVVNNPIEYFDLLGLVKGLVKDKCEKGRIRYVKCKGIGFKAFGRDGNPDSISLGTDALKAVQNLDDIQKFTDLATGRTVADFLKKVSEVSIEKAKEPENDNIIGIIAKIDELIKTTEGVAIHIKVCFETCEKTPCKLFGLKKGGDIFWTDHLDWVEKCYWHRSNQEPEDNGVFGGGFKQNDKKGIGMAIRPSIIEAFNAIDKKK